jgi:phage tail protein X
VYDTVSNLSWGVDVRTHGIVGVIEKVLNVTWPPAAEVGREVPEALEEVDCVVRFFSFQSPFGSCVLTEVQECYSWEFGE